MKPYDGKTQKVRSNVYPNQGSLKDYNMFDLVGTRLLPHDSTPVPNLETEAPPPLAEKVKYQRKREVLETKKS